MWPFKKKEKQKIYPYNIKDNKQKAVWDALYTPEGWKIFLYVYGEAMQYRIRYDLDASVLKACSSMMYMHAKNCCSVYTKRLLRKRITLGYYK